MTLQKKKNKSAFGPLSTRQVIIVPVGSSSVPTKTNYEVARVVPVGSESTGALVVLEVGKVAVVVLNIANGLTTLKLRVELLLCRVRHSNRRCCGRAEKSEKGGSELHVVMLMMVGEGREGAMFVMDSKALGTLDLLPSYTFLT
jgi:hypothetical protein